MKKVSLVFLFLFISSGVFAQTWEVGGFAGGAAYLGDLNPLDPFRIKKPAFGGQLKYNFDAYWALKLNGMHGNIRASDAESDNEQYRQRNLSFFSPVTELSLQAEFNFFNYVPSISHKLYTPYLFAGIGGVVFNPQATYNGNVYELALYRTEGQDAAHAYKRYALTVPYGAGIKYNITGKWSLIAEIGYRTALTDYLDDVSGLYADKTKLQNAVAVALSDRSGENNGIYLGAPGTQRGDLRKRDTYMFTGLSITYTFITRKCPVVQ